MSQDIESISKSILERLPQQAPFRFLDRVVEVDDDRIIGQYTFKEDESFYEGHFPGRPITPGVILIETMAQTAVVAFGIYLFDKANRDNPDFDVNDYLSVFTDVEADFVREVPPGETVTVRAEKLFFRRGKLKCKAELCLENGEVAAQANLAGLAVSRKKNS